MPIRASARTAQPVAQAVAERIADGLKSELPNGKIKTVNSLGWGSRSGNVNDDVFTVVDRPGLGAFLSHPFRNSAQTVAGVYDFAGEPNRNILVVASHDVFDQVQALARNAARELNVEVDVFDGKPKPSRNYSK